MDKQEKRDNFENRFRNVLKNKQEAQERYAARKMERLVMQYNCS